MGEDGWVVGRLEASEGHRPRDLGKGDPDDGGDEEEDGKDKDAAFRSGEAAGEIGPANGVGGKQVAAHEETAVGDAVEEGLSPVPRSVEADRPPE